MRNNSNIKDIVKAKYGEIAGYKPTNEKSPGGCCTPSENSLVQISCCDSSDDELKILGNEYEMIEGHLPDADLGLGCGIPTEFANINKGDTVLDLGSGAGNDVFIARNYVGEDGWVIGVDMTEEMLEKADQNRLKLGYSNVEFRLGDIENLPVNDNTIDVVVSNCVINLVPDKHKVYKEIYRTLKPGAHFCISDIVTKGELPEALQQSAELYTGCVAGAMDVNAVMELLENIGYSNLKVDAQKEIYLEDKLLKKILNEDEISEFRKKEIGIYSITISGYKK